MYDTVIPLQEIDLDFYPVPMYWYYVTLDSLTTYPVDKTKARMWLTNNIQGRFCIINERNFVFENELEATLFAIAYNGNITKE